MTVKIIEGDCLEQTRQYENHFDSIVTDPPYGLKFMGKEWDHGVPGKHYWERFLIAAKPGAHLLAFGGTRTHHRLMVAIEDAGWEIRDTLMWVYSSGFPKSLDVSKAIDKAAGAARTEGAREWKGGLRHSNSMGGGSGQENGTTTLIKYDTPATDAAKQWDGWGTALKPAYEIIILARKPLDGTVANNVLKWGCGGINVDGCRVPLNGDKPFSYPNGAGGSDPNHMWRGKPKGDGCLPQVGNSLGRFPANLIHDGSQTVLDLFPDRKTTWVSTEHANNRSGKFLGALNHPGQQGFNDSGSAARFFYCAKASKSERNLGCDNLPLKSAGECTDRQDGTAGLNSPRAGAGRTNGSRNTHPTVKPIALMRYLCRLITQPNGIILDPFAGSGSTGVAATLEGFNSVLIEIEAGSANIARARNGVAPVDCPDCPSGLAT